jgi:putative modified peptide
VTSVETASVRAATRESAATVSLLARLASDDAFRAEFEQRPGEVLAALGLPGTIRDGPVTLPTKEDLRALLAGAVARRSLMEPDDPIVFTHAM